MKGWFDKDQLEVLVGSSGPPVPACGSFRWPLQNQPKDVLRVLKVHGRSGAVSPESFVSRTEATNLQCDTSYDARLRTSCLPASASSDSWFFYQGLQQINGYGSQQRTAGLSPAADRGFESMFPFNRVPFWTHTQMCFFEGTHFRLRRETKRLATIFGLQIPSSQPGRK